MSNQFTDIVCPFCWPHDYGALDPDGFSCSHCGTHNMPTAELSRVLDEKEADFKRMVEGIRQIIREVNEGVYRSQSAPLRR